MSQAFDEAAFLLRIRQEMLHEWDPIGIQQFAGAQDEYDSYAPVLSRLILNNADAEEIFSYLWEIETQYMGLCGDIQRTRVFAERAFRIGQEASRSGAAPDKSAEPGTNDRL